MGLITKEVLIKVTSRNAVYYDSLGYDVPIKPASETYHKVYGKEFVYDFNSKIIVKVKDLPENSKTKVKLICDKCGKETETKYSTYFRSFSNFGQYLCTGCANKQAAITRKKLCQDKYNVDNMMQLSWVKEKAIITNKGRYGTSYTLQFPEIRERITKTLYENSSQKSSRQQRYICNLYYGILNFPVTNYNCDIYLPEDNLVVEYDGGFHMGNVITGRETEEEHNKKEIVRNNIIKREGYKMIRLISYKDLLPSDEILLQLLSHSKEYFSSYPNRSWIEFNIDTSTVRNAEHGEVFFNFGQLRRIKKSDLQEETTILETA